MAIPTIPPTTPVSTTVGVVPPSLLRPVAPVRRPGVVRLVGVSRCSHCLSSSFTPTCWLLVLHRHLLLRNALGVVVCRLGFAAGSHPVFFDEGVCCQRPCCHGPSWLRATTQLHNAAMARAATSYAVVPARYPVVTGGAVPGGWETSSATMRSGETSALVPFLELWYRAANAMLLVMSPTATTARGAFTGTPTLANPHIHLLQQSTTVSPLIQGHELIRVSSRGSLPYRRTSKLWLQHDRFKRCS